MRKTIYHLLNETGRILIRTTTPPDQLLPEAVRKEFSSVTVFCAGMMRAISSTINPASGLPFSIYNYHAIESILLRSGRFIKVSEDSLIFKTHKNNHEFSHALYHQLFSIRLGHKETRTISAILSGLGTEAKRMLESGSNEEYKAGHITFIVEYFDGVPDIIVKSIYIDCNQHKKSINRAPCNSKSWCRTSWILHTESYRYISNV